MRCLDDGSDCYVYGLTVTARLSGFAMTFVQVFGIRGLTNAMCAMCDAQGVGCGDSCRLQERRMSRVSQVDDLDS